MSQQEYTFEVKVRFEPGRGGQPAILHLRLEQSPSLLQQVLNTLCTVVSVWAALLLVVIMVILLAG